MALGGVVVDPLGTIAVNGNYYVNTKLGLGFEKPEGWQFEAFKDFGTLLEGQIVEKLSPEEEEAFRREQASTLVVVIIDDETLLLDQRAFPLILNT